MKILAIDPGESTGIAFLDTTKPNEISGTVVHLWEKIDHIIWTTRPDIIVIEAFRLYRHKAQAQIGSWFPSVQVIGVVKYLAERAQIPIAEQMASVAKFLPRNPRIRNAHVQDAWRHAEAYRRRHPG